MTQTRPSLVKFTLCTLVALGALRVGVLGCAATQAAAAHDPLRCERDPSCAERADKSKDCVTQCVDDPACIDRCREVTGQFR
jgi:hypothetical protein